MMMKWGKVVYLKIVFTLVLYVNDFPTSADDLSITVLLLN